MSGHDHAPRDGTGRTVALNLAVNIGLTAVKWSAFLLTGSPSLFGEAAHSTADSLNPILLWTGHVRGKRPGCRRHPLGHGRETFFWSLVAAQMMLIIGAGLTAYRGIEAVATGHSPEFSPWSLGIMAAVLLAEGYTFTRAWLNLRKEKGGSLAEKIGRSPDTVLLGVFLENGVDILAAMLAFAGFGLFVLTGEPLWDAAFSLLIAAVLTASSLFLMNRNRSLLIGEAAPAEVAAGVAAVLKRRPAVAEVAEIEAVLIGHDRIQCRIRLKLDHEYLVNGWCSGPAAGPHLAGDPVRWSLAIAVEETRAAKQAVLDEMPAIASVEIELL